MKLLSPIKRFFKHPVRNIFRCMVASAIVAAIFGGVAIHFGQKSAEQLECNYQQLPAEALPGSGPVRIAFVCDIHNAPDKLEKSIAHLKKAKPDIILLGGDYVMAHQRFMRTRWMVNGLRKLAEIAPVFAILGNHDYEKLDQVERVMQTAEIPILRNEARTWETPAGGTVCLVGLGDWNEGDEDPHSCLLPQGEEESAVLLLSHDPESRWLLRQYDWDLMLSGHTHGGQIGNPFTTPVQYISFRSSMPAGLFDFEGGRRVFVSRGAGSILGMRFFCAPEINIIDIGDRASFTPPAEDAEDEADTTEQAEETDSPEEEESTEPAPVPTEPEKLDVSPSAADAIPAPPPAEDSTITPEPPAPADDTIIPELPVAA
ncbi:MAG: metallophosphoesterase [Akkermansia sp.]|nr:metallophosphoesterase [Akkermansia sp.]